VQGPECESSAGGPEGASPGGTQVHNEPPATWNPECAEPNLQNLQKMTPGAKGFATSPGAVDHRGCGFAVPAVCGRDESWNSSSGRWESPGGAGLGM
jgi:hypothetical protein